VVGVGPVRHAWLAAWGGSLGAAFNIHAMRTAQARSASSAADGRAVHGAIYYLETSSFITREFAQAPTRRAESYSPRHRQSWDVPTWGVSAAARLVLGLGKRPSRREL